MTVLVWLIVIVFLGAAVARWWQVRQWGDPPGFRTEDHPRWYRCRWLGIVD